MDLSSPDNWLILFALAWFVLNRFILPRAGVPT